MKHMVYKTTFSAGAMIPNDLFVHANGPVYISRTSGMLWDELVFSWNEDDTPQDCVDHDWVEVSNLYSGVVSKHCVKCRLDMGPQDSV